MDRLTLALEAARAAPSADNSQPWQLSWSGSHLSVHYRPHLGIDPFGPTGHATLISIGALSENLAQAIQEATPAITLGNLSRGKPYFSMPIANPLAPSNAHDLPLFQRHTNRHPYTREAPETAMLDTLPHFREGPAHLSLLTTYAERENFARLAHVCCLARFCNRELHDWLMSSLRFAPGEVARGDGLDIATLHLPPGGKAFMQAIRPWPRMALLNRFGAYRFMAATEVRPLRQAPLILTVVGEDSPEGAFTAGRLMERAWIHLNQLGWAVHPYYVISDQETRLHSDRLAEDWVAPVSHALDGVREVLRIQRGLRLHIALRVGRPTRVPQRSQRLPLEAIFIDETKQ